MNLELRTRAKLSSAQVIQIFRIKQTLPMEPAAKVAIVFGVSEKTVRDIWNGRTWIKETWHLDTARVVVQKNIGRPKGVRDSKPRMPKTEKRKDKSVLWSTYEMESGTPNSQYEEIAILTESESSNSNTLSQDNENNDIEWPQFFCSAPFHLSQPETGEDTSQLQNQGDSARSVDQQLHDWDQVLWLDLESEDPFRKDWTLQQGKAVVGGSGLLDDENHAGCFLADAC